MMDAHTDTGMKGKMCPFSPELDVVFSEVLVLLACAIGGFGIYRTVVVTPWSFPLLVVGVCLWGLSCVGLIRLWELVHGGKE